MHGVGIISRNANLTVHLWKSTSYRYMHTADSSEEELEQFYKSSTDAIEKFNKHDMTVIMGDLNAKIGKAKNGYCFGDHGLGTRNESGERL